MAQWLLGGGVDSRHQATLTASSLVLVDDSLGRCGVDALDRQSSLLGDVGAAFLGGEERTLRAGLQF